MTVAEALEQAGKNLQAQYGDAAIPVSELKQKAAQLSRRPLSSILPSDFCYNLTNDGIKFPQSPMFIQEGSGLYKFLGRHYPYNGIVVHTPKGRSERVFGSWHEGKFTRSAGK